MHALALWRAISPFSSLGHSSTFIGNSSTLLKFPSLLLSPRMTGVKLEQPTEAPIQVGCQTNMAFMKAQADGGCAGFESGS
jgi:hypothetical protein